AAPRSLIICAMSRMVRLAKESMTSSAVTSTITPRERYRPTCSTSESRSCSRSASVSADWIVAMRYGPCLRIGTSIHSLRGRSDRGRCFFQRHHLVAEQALGFLDPPLQVAHRVHLPEVDADVDQRLG